MSTINNIQGTDRVKDSRAVINDNFTNLNTDKVETLADLGLIKTASEYNSAVDTAPTANEKAALAGGGDLGTPSGSNKFVTVSKLEAELLQENNGTAPVIEASQTSSGTTVTMPSGIVAGEILLLVVGNDSANSTITASGWSVINTGGLIHVIAKIAAGGDSLTYSTSGGANFTNTIFRISGSVPGIAITDYVKAIRSSDGTPVGLEPFIHKSTNMWLVGGVSTGGGAPTFTGAPTGYGGLVSNNIVSTTKTGVAFKNAFLRHETPGTFTMSSGSAAQAITIAVRGNIDA
jgi:hypothetical protein